MYISGIQQDLNNINTFGGNVIPITGNISGTGIGSILSSGILIGSGTFSGIGTGVISGYYNSNLIISTGSAPISNFVYFIGLDTVNISLTVMDTGQYTGLASGTLYTGYSTTLNILNSGQFTINQTFTGNVTSASGLLGISLPPVGGFSGKFLGNFTGSGLNIQLITGIIIENMSGLLMEGLGDLAEFQVESGNYTGAPFF